MADALPTRGGLCRQGVSRSAADIKAELELVVRLRSGLPTSVQPGEYEAMLEAHLTSLSSALQLELEQSPLASGTNEPVGRRPLLAAHWPAYPLHGLSRHCMCACTGVHDSY
jgi:hypothetical protein